ncbi:hypothetical protein Tco_1305251, partial [Tanacetum coccineum]
VDPHGFEGYLKIVVEVPDSSCLTRSIATCSYQIDTHKDFMKGSNTYFKTSTTLITKMAKRLCLVDDLKMLKITMSNTSSRNKLNPKINDHYNILTGECQKDELKTKDKALVWKSVRYDVSKVLDMAYWGFLGVGTTFDIFQNIHILYLEYGVLTSSGYGVLSFIPLWSLVSAGTDTPYLP